MTRMTGADRPAPRPYPVKGAANLSLVRRIRKAGARVVQNSLVIDFPRAVIFKTRRYKREGCCFAAVRESVVGTKQTWYDV
jgi:hypothetical protein